MSATDGADEPGPERDAAVDPTEADASARLPDAWKVPYLRLAIGVGNSGVIYAFPVAPIPHRRKRDRFALPPSQSVII